MGSSYIKRYITEWQSTISSHFVAGYWLNAWAAAIALGVVSLLIRWRQKPVLDLSMETAAFGLSQSAIRFVPEGAIFSGPVITRGIKKMATWFKAGVLDRRPLLELVLVGWMTTSALTYGYSFSLSETRPFGWGFSGKMPYTEVAEIKRQQLKGVVYNEYQDGALIIQQLWPDVRPTIDSRIDIFGEQLHDEYLHATDSPTAFANYLAKYNVNLVLLRFQQHKQIYDLMLRDPAWQLTYQTKDRYLFVKKPVSP
jgi:hypothetical protein